MFRRNVWQMIILVTIILIFATACGGEEEAESMQLTVALSSPHVWIQPVIAECEGYYEEVGLEVEHVRFTSGRAAMDALIGGQAEIATTAISPVIFAAFQEQPMAILAENARFLDEKLTARVESEISEPADLAGKRIGVTLGSDVHYFLYLYLEYAGLTVDDVDIVNLGPGDMVISLVNGDVDAFASWRPQPDNAKAEMGDGAVFLTQPDPPIFESLYLIVGMQELVSANPEVYERFMEAMVMADEYAAENPDGVTECVAAASEVDLETAENLMAGYQFRIWLDKSMIEGSEKRAVFQLDNDLAPEGAGMPDFREFIAEGPLEAVDPDRVTLD